MCRISPDGKLLATGGCDGILRVWTFPDLNAVHEIEAHGKEIDDMVKIIEYLLKAFLNILLSIFRISAQTIQRL